MKNIKYSYLIYIFVFLFPNIISLSNITVIPFKTFYPSYSNTNKKFTPLDYYNSYHLSNIYLEIEVGNKNQILSLFLNLDDYLFVVEDNADISYNNLCKYSTELSDTFKVINSENIIIGKPSFYSSDSFKIYKDLTKEKNKMITMQFLYYKNNINYISYACGKVGLLYPSNKNSDLWKRNFFNQINKGRENIDYSFTLKYDNENKDIDIEKMNNGLFIIGIESYEKNINKNNNLINIYNKADQYGMKQKWKFQLDNIYIGNIKYNIYENIEININIKTDIEGFEFPKYIFDKLNEIYFNKYYNDNICTNEIIDKKISFIIIFCYADKFSKKDINKFPEIHLLKYKLGFNFSFSGEELFYNNEKKYFFKILFNSKSYRKDFNLGRLFLKKYQVIFNPESYYMSFYKITKIKNEKIQEENSIFFPIMIKFVFISIIFLIFGFYLGRKFCIFRKNKNAKELEDDNNYLTENEIHEIKKENQLIEF